MKNNKISITQKEFNEIYQIEEITGETKPIEEPREAIATKPGDTTPFLTEEEEEQDRILEEKLDWSPEEQ